MPINKETIISVFDEKLTLMQWLKTINKALEEAVLTGVEVRQKGNATYSFVVTFEDGTELESNEFVLAQGESINGATIRNGHLYLSLTNGDELDAGNLKPVTSFTINASQHLIVNYGDGTSQDLGPIFSGNVNIDGKLTANSIIENMSGYAYTQQSGDFIMSDSYVSACKNGNKLTLVVAGVFTPTTSFGGYIGIGDFTIPQEIGALLVPLSIGGLTYVLDVKSAEMFSSISASVNVKYRTDKVNNTKLIVLLDATNVVANTTYVFRYEVTFLLSDNLAV